MSRNYWLNAVQSIMTTINKYIYVRVSPHKKKGQCAGGTKRALFRFTRALFRFIRALVTF